MRVNVYGEELTDRIEVVSKEVVEEATGETFTFYGVRFWLKFPNQPWWIHRKVDGEEDDDSSAVTFWNDDPVELAGMLAQAEEALLLQAGVNGRGDVLTDGSGEQIDVVKHLPEDEG